MSSVPTRRPAEPSAGSWHASLTPEEGLPGPGQSRGGPGPAGHLPPRTEGHTGARPGHGDTWLGGQAPGQHPCAGRGEPGQGFWGSAVRPLQWLGGGARSPAAGLQQAVANLQRGHAEVCDPDVVLLIQQQVFWFQIPVAGEEVRVEATQGQELPPLPKTHPPSTAPVASSLVVPHAANFRSRLPGRWQVVCRTTDKDSHRSQHVLPQGPRQALLYALPLPVLFPPPPQTPALSLGHPDPRPLKRPRKGIPKLHGHLAESFLRPLRGQERM